jgi:hypothetical protein
MHIFLAIENQRVTQMTIFERKFRGFAASLQRIAQQIKHKGMKSYFQRFHAFFGLWFKPQTFFSLRCKRQSTPVWFLTYDLWLGLMQQIHQTHMLFRALPFCLLQQIHDLER